MPIMQSTQGYLPLTGGTLTGALQTITGVAIRFGGSTSSFPALKQVSTSLQARLADDSNYAGFICDTLTAAGGVIAGSSTARMFFTDTTTLTLVDQPTTGGASWRFLSMTAPSNTSAGQGKLFLRDNGSGKMQFAAIFPSGAVQVIATEP